MNENTLNVVFTYVMVKKNKKHTKQKKMWEETVRHVSSNMDVRGNLTCFRPPPLTRSA